ncbi:reelin domain-containing protein 1 [Centropristis striata]|uniref:reelin domain-containing protein 1 n=1 Tax=Centropristis striata TaxID=184440 RepID=UPI0027E0AFD6|nr:reelin domain-containing protein 1 [Centropristis striata]
MRSTQQCFWVGVVLLSLALSAVAFSRGASHASCREMIPGHIRAQPQDLQRRHVTLHTSASSYLPGQLVTVTVRSSRDFMGFLLQARSVKDAGVEVRSMRMGPVLLGGSWTLTPPGTHTLRCLSEGDTLTHSDKQLKRNLSFVWRAPDAPMGDIRFYITVVQSYFVYWAGIESGVVRDGSRSPWRGTNITGVDGGKSIFAPQEDKVTALPGSSSSLTEDPKSTFVSSNHPPPLDSFASAETKGMEATTTLLPNTTVQNSTSPLFMLHPISPLDDGPSPAPLRSLYNPLTSTSSPVPSQQLTLGERLPIKNNIASFDPEPSLNLPTPRTVVHPNPEPHPNLDPNLKLNLGHELKPNLPKTDTKLKRPSNPPRTPDKEGKYPDIIPRHSAWELGMLLGCSAGLGMVLVVGVRYMYRQACGKRTEVTLNDREREYGRGERGLLHVQECGDLVRVRRIRDNSFVLLAEYDILASPGD